MCTSAHAETLKWVCVAANLQRENLDSNVQEMNEGSNTFPSLNTCACIIMFSHSMHNRAIRLQRLYRVYIYTGSYTQFIHVYNYIIILYICTCIYTYMYAVHTCTQVLDILLISFLFVFYQQSQKC